MLSLQTGERVESVCRRHWFIFGVAIAELGIAIVAALALPTLIAWFVPALGSAYGPWIRGASALLAELLWIALFFILTDYYLDAWIITNRRLVFIELHGLFNRTTASVNLEDVQDISVRTRGIVSMVLKFGDVRIQSAGTHGEFVFKEIPHPDRMKDVVMRLRAERAASGGNV